MRISFCNPNYPSRSTTPAASFFRKCSPYSEASGKRYLIIVRWKFYYFWKRITLRNFGSYPFDARQGKFCREKKNVCVFFSQVDRTRVKFKATHIVSLSLSRFLFVRISFVSLQQPRLPLLLQAVRNADMDDEPCSFPLLLTVGHRCYRNINYPCRTGTHG